MRICRRGHELKPENTYVRPNGTRTCKTCKQAYDREYRQQNSEKRRAYDREYYHRNSEKLKAYNHAYYHRNSEKLKAYKREYYGQHRDERLAYSKRHYRELKERYGGRPWANKQALVRREQERHGTPRGGIKRED